MIETYSGRLLLSTIGAIIIVILHEIFKWLQRRFWPSTGEEGGDHFDTESEEYRRFIEEEMERLNGKQKRTRSRQQPEQARRIKRREDQNPGQYDKIRVPGLEAAGERQKTTGAAAELALDWMRHPDLFRPQKSLPVSRSAEKRSSRVAKLKQESTSEDEMSSKFCSMDKPGPTIPASTPTTPTTPTRQIKSEHTKISPLASPFSGPNNFPIKPDLTPSPATITASPPSYHTRSPSPHLPLPRFPRPGDLVFRRRPAKLILKHTVDEIDLWDGPFTVLSTTLQSWVELLLPEGSRTPAWTAVTDIIFASNQEAQIENVEINLTGKKLYMIDKVRAVKGKAPGKRRFLVHWKGWGSEDDTWEPEQGLPKESIKDYERRARIWEETRGRWVSERPRVEVVIRK